MTHNVVLVDAQDVEIGVCDKRVAHLGRDSAIAHFRYI